MKQKPTQQELYDAANTLWRAAEYIQEDAGSRDIQWNTEYQEATKILQHLSRTLTRRAVKMN